MSCVRAGGPWGGRRGADALRLCCFHLTREAGGRCGVGGSLEVRLVPQS